MENKELTEIMLASAKKSAELQETLHNMIMNNLEHMTLDQIREFYKATTNYLLDSCEIIRRYNGLLQK